MIICTGTSVNLRGGGPPNKADVLFSTTRICPTRLAPSTTTVTKRELPQNRVTVTVAYSKSVVFILHKDTTTYLSYVSQSAVCRMSRERRDSHRPRNKS